MFVVTLLTLSLQLWSYRTLPHIIVKDSLLFRNTYILATFEYLVVHYYHEKIKKPIWCMKCMLFTRHSEFCHQSFDTSIEHISVFIGGRANISQTFFFLSLADEILSFFISLCFLRKQF